jgi:peptidyl-tRNA hydrolase, PTH1 family
LKYLIVGLGNIGKEYEHTRHNIGFDILDQLAVSSKIGFEEKKLAFVADYKYRSRIFKLVKPSTYVNLSGKAINYWLQKEKIPVSNLLVLVDDISLPFGMLRLKPAGSDAGHNGLINIIETLGHKDFARLRFGTGDNFSQGQQIDYVLGKWSAEERLLLHERINKSIEIIQNFGTIGISMTMNKFNNK